MLWEFDFTSSSVGPLMSSQLEDSNSWIPQIGNPCDAQIFSLTEAQSLLPVVRKVTCRAVGDFDPPGTPIPHGRDLKHGFTIDRAGVIEERNQFFWIVSYDGPDSWESKQAAYYGSPERASLEPDPAQYIARADRWFLDPLPLPG